MGTKEPEKEVFEPGGRKQQLIEKMSSEALPARLPVAGKSSTQVAARAACASFLLA
jgi:hypothetical protein